DGLGCIGDLVCPDVERVPEELPNDDECTNCPTVAKVADRNTYDENVYYANALVASDEELRGAINKDISKDQKKLTYSEVWTVVTHSDEDPTDAGKVIEIYTGRSIGKGLNAGKIGNSGDAWNREHVWAKSHGFPDQGQYAYTDAHHLRPADASVNSERSNLDFDNGGTPITEAPENAKDSDSFEPRDQMKGDVARMLFYMDVRYEGAASDNTPDLVLVDRTG
ncbi:MAG: endonuclease, partial [Psychrobium sp.]